MKNGRKITWVSGPAAGFYIDLDNQKIGYSGEEKSLTHLQTGLLQFMLSRRGEFVTANDTAIHPELFSIDFSKYISTIKSFIKALWRSADKAQDASEAVDEIFEKRSTYGNTGYRIKIEITDKPDWTDETAADKPGSDKTGISSTELVSSPLTAKELRASYFKNNWLPLFIYAFLILGNVLFLDSIKCTIKSILINIIKIPFGFTFIFLSVMSVMPIVCGLLIDVPLALREYKRKNGITGKITDPETIHNAAMYKVPRFDNSKEHVAFFLLCNLTGAFTAAAALLYVKSIPGILDLISEINNGYAYIIILVIGLLVALFNNYSLQTTPSLSRCAENYILTRAHAFLNLIHLSITLPFAGSLIYTFMSVRFHHPEIKAFITSAYIVLIVSGCCYLWFSADSPSARKIDSISKDNFITGLPLVMTFTTTYTLMCFKPDLVSILALITTPLFLTVWLFYFMKRRKSHSVKLYYFLSSFFSVMAFSVILMLVLGFWV